MIRIVIDWPEVLAFLVGLTLLFGVKNWLKLRGNPVCRECAKGKR